MDVFLVYTIVIILLNTVIGFLVLLQNPRKKVNISFFFAAIFSSLWSLSIYYTEDVSSSLQINQISNQSSYIFAYLTIFTFTIFTFYFPNGNIRRLKKFYTYLSLSLIGFAIAILPNAAGTVIKTSDGDLLFTTGELTGTYIVILVIMAVIGVYNLISIYHKSTGKQRIQVYLILLGFAIAFGLIVLFNLLLPTVSSQWGLAKYGPAITIIFISTVAYAITRHGLFDIRPYLARALGYIFTIFTLVVLFVGVIFITLDTILDIKISTTQDYILAFIITITALISQPLKKFFDRISNKIFYQDAYDVQVILNRIGTIIISTSDLEILTNDLAELIRDTFNTNLVKFHINPGSSISQHGINKNSIISNNADWQKYSIIENQYNKNIYNIDDDDLKSDIRNYLETNSAALLVRLETNTQFIGIIFIGFKKNGNIYNSIDYNIINVLREETSLAIDNILRLKEIERFNETLQQNVKKATTDLQKSNEKLKSLDEAKDEFISMASHQLRTPLTSVKGYISMLLEGDAGPITDQQKTFLSQAFTSSQRMVYLIADLLNVSRLKTGKFVIEPTEVNLPQVVKTEVEQLQTTADSRGLTLKVDCPKDFPTLMLDETKIHQVIMNFIDNAIYYTPSGGSIKVVLSVNSKTAELRVIDTGIGVPKKAQHELFTKFYRAENAQKARPDGTGLGLYMAKKVIIAQGGSVIFSSVENKGSTFGFSFALSKVLPNKTEDSK